MSKGETIVQKHSTNFDTLSKAFANGDVCLLDCIDRSTGEHVAVICAVQDDGGVVELMPFAAMFNHDPYEQWISPLEYEQKEGYELQGS